MKHNPFQQAQNRLIETLAPTLGHEQAALAVAQLLRAKCGLVTSRMSSKDLDAITNLVQTILQQTPTR